MDCSKIKIWVGTYCVKLTLDFFQMKICGIIWDLIPQQGLQKKKHDATALYQLDEADN